MSHHFVIQTDRQSDTTDRS